MSKGCPDPLLAKTMLRYPCEIKIRLGSNFPRFCCWPLDFSDMGLKIASMTGLEIRGCQEPAALLNSTVATSNFCREPKDVLVSIQNTLS